MRLHIEMNSVEALAGVLLIELQDALDAGQQVVAVFAGLIGFGAGQQGFDADVGAVQNRDDAG